MDQAQNKNCELYVYSVRCKPRIHTLFLTNKKQKWTIQNEYQKSNNKISQFFLSYK